MRLVDVDKIKNRYNDNWPSEIAEGFQMAIDEIEDAPTVEAIPVEWVENYITLLVIGSHSDHEPELEEENKKKAQAIRQMVEDWGCPEQYDKCIEKLREIQHRQAEELLERVKTDKTVGCVLDDYAIGLKDYRELESWKNLVETVREFETKKLEERISNTEKTLKELKEDLARYLTLPTGY